MPSMKKPKEGGNGVRITRASLGIIPQEETTLPQSTSEMGRAVFAAPIRLLYRNRAAQ